MQQPAKTIYTCIIQIVLINHKYRPYMYFTEHQKDELYQWVDDNLRIKGMKELRKQITRDGKVNHNWDKDGLFFQAQITRQLAESERYSITMVENKGVGYDIDIELDGRIYLQAWLGSNVVGHILDKEIAKSKLPRTLYSASTCQQEDLDVLQHKLGQLNKPTSNSGAFESSLYNPYAQCPLWPQVNQYPYTVTLPDIGSNILPVKILVVMSPTLLPPYFLPEWNYLLQDRIIMELRGNFNRVGNLYGAATLHRSSNQWDEVAKEVVDALGFRYVESFNGLNAGKKSMRFGSLPVSAWSSSYLNTASQHIRLQPKVMAIGMNSDFVTEYFMDMTECETTPEYVNSFLNDELRSVVSHVIWADVERPDQSVSTILGTRHLESFDRIITDRNLVKNSRPKLYDVYGVDRDKTDAFDSVVVDAGDGDLEIEHVEILLDDILSRSNKTPDCFLGDSMAIMEMLELGSTCGYTKVMATALGNNVVRLNSFMGIPVLDDFGSGPRKRGCIYAINYKDELNVPSGLRLLGSSFRATELLNVGSNRRVAYVIGETAVDPRACGKIINIRERL